MSTMHLKEDDENYDVLYPVQSYTDFHSSDVPGMGTSVEVKQPKGSGLTPSGLNGAASHHDIYKISNDDRTSVHFGVHNIIAIKVVFGLMIFSILIVLFLAYLVLISRLRCSQQEEDNLIGAVINSKQLYGNINKGWLSTHIWKYHANFVAVESKVPGKSPYVITPTKKIAQQLFAFENMPKEIECESMAIATVLLFLAKNSEPPSGVMFYPVHPSARLVSRPRTKFDDLFLSHYQLQSELQKMMMPINFAQAAESENDANPSKRDFFDAKREEILADDERNQSFLASFSLNLVRLFYAQLPDSSLCTVFVLSGISQEAAQWEEKIYTTSILRPHLKRSTHNPSSMTSSYSFYI
uniref:TPA-induced transmembrane protein n=1 Tax=Ascaris lumbricoides TaxID=6252 RepID=A0A0M3IFA3_ASCLU